MTNAHVMDGAVNITVTLHVGTRLPAELNLARIVETSI